jgi:hypothetical protein
MNGSIEDQAGQLGIWSRFKGLLTSITLIGATLFISTICAIVLAATLTQTRISSLAIDGVSLSIWKLDSVRQEWQAIREQQQRETKALGIAEIKRPETSAKKTAAESNYDINLKVLTSLLGEFNFRVRPFDPALAAAISGQSPAEQVDRIPNCHRILRAFMTPTQNSKRRRMKEKPREQMIVSWCIKLIT